MKKIGKSISMKITSIKKIIKIFTLGIFLFTTYQVEADTNSHGMTIPTAHPRLFWTPARISQAQTWATDNNYTGITSSTDQRTKYDLLFTCLILDNATACTNAIDDAVAQLSCDESRRDRPSCDPNRWHGEWVILTYDWLYDKMTPAQRTTIEDRWAEDQEFWNTKSWGGPQSPNSNYFFGKQRNSFEFGVAFMEHEDRATDLLDDGLNTFWPSTIHYVDGIGGVWDGSDDGGFGYGAHTIDGSSYNRYGLHYSNIMLATAPILGRDLQEETTAYKAAVFHMIYSTMPVSTIGRSGFDMFPNGDDSIWQNGNPAGNQWYGDFIQNAANIYSDSNVGRYAKEYINRVSPTISATMRSVAPSVSPLSFTNLPLDYYASGPGWLFTRNNWTDDATVMQWQMESAKGGSDHTHRDAGSFQVFRKGVNIIRETPGYSESIANYGSSGTISLTSSLAHNSPILGGVGQMRESMKAVGSKGGGTISRLDIEPEYSFVASDITQTYHFRDDSRPERSNLHAVNVVRELYFLRDIETMVVVDRLETDATDVSTSFVSHCENNFNISGNVSTCTVSGQEAKYTALVPSAPNVSVVTENANDANAHKWQYRLESENSNPGSVYSYSIYTIEMSDSGASTITSSIVDSDAGNPLSGTFTITLDASNAITINKGMNSTGGSITAEGVTKTLSSTVDNMSITDDGPVFSNVADTVAPILNEVTAVTTPTTDSTPDYTFNSNEAGTITYGGDCSSSTTSVVSGNNTITLNTLIDGTYSNCTITVIDVNGNSSDVLNIAAFIVNTTITIRADVDQSGSINFTDALLTLRNSLGLEMSGTNWQVSATTGAVDCDGNSNSTDALLILRKALGLDMFETDWCEN